MKVKFRLVRDEYRLIRMAIWDDLAPPRQMSVLSQWRSKSSPISAT